MSVFQAAADHKAAADKATAAAAAVPSTVPHVIVAMHAISGDLAKVGIGKDSFNKEQKFRFRGIDAVMNALAPLLVKHNLLILPHFRDRGLESRITKSGGTMFNVTVTGDFEFCSVLDASTRTITTIGEGQDVADKATNKAMAIAYKYAVFQGFCIPLDKADDPDDGAPEETAPDPTLGNLGDLVEEFKLRALEAGSLKELSDLFTSAQGELKAEAKKRSVDRAHLIDCLGALTKIKDEAKARHQPPAPPA